MLQLARNMKGRLEDEINGVMLKVWKSDKAKN
jgi:hypothetical protein